MTSAVEKLCHEKGILVIPDFVANAGGVISSSVEHAGGGEKEMFRTVESKIRENTELVLSKMEKDGVSPRDAALSIAKERVRKGG